MPFSVLSHLLYLLLLCSPSFVGRIPDSGTFSLHRMKETVKIFERLESRTKCSYAEFTAALDLRAAKYGKVR